MTAILSAHALKRMYQRGIARWQVELALRHGKRVYAQGGLFVFLGRRQLEKIRPEIGPRWTERLEGLTLVLDPRSRMLLTCFKNRDFLRKIRHKD